MKECIICGENKPMDSFNKRSGGGRRNVCKTCQNSQRRDYYSKNKEKILMHSLRYKKSNQDKIKSCREKSIELYREKDRIYRKNSVESLSDSYVLQLIYGKIGKIVSKSTLSNIEWISDIIKVKRIEIKLNRKLKNLNNETSK